MRSPALLLLTFSLALAPRVAARGGAEVFPVSPAPGQLLALPGGQDLAEILAVRAGVVDRLATLAPGETITLGEWPWAPGERREVTLTLLEIYAADARIVWVDGTATREVPRSVLRFFAGPTDRGGTDRLLVELDPASGRLTARSFREDGPYRLELLGDTRPDADELAARLVPETADEDTAAGWACGQESLAAEDSPAGLDFAAPLAASSWAPELITTLHTATIAVDTDNELMFRKFGNNAASATTYLAQLFAAMNVMYERDVLVRMLQGTTFLRPSTTLDPYVQPCGDAVTDCQTNTAADGARLDEFSNYWAAGCGGGAQPSCAGVQRALAMMLSGKQQNTFSASGIAWLDALCSTGIGYSFSQVFKFSGATGASDSKLVGHELGHNFGSPHTHNPSGYSPPIDTCCTAITFGNASCGTNYCTSGGLCCSDGAQACNACPSTQTINGVPSVRGTLMSYCHSLSGCTSSEVFHPRSVTEQVGPHVQSRVGVCVFPFDPFAAGFRDGFEAGLVPPWSGKRP